MNLIELFSLVSVLAYVIATAAALAALLGQNLHFSRTALLFTVIGFCANGLLIIHGYAVSDSLHSMRAFYLVPLAWCLVGAGLFMRWRLKMDMLLLFTPPLALLLLFFSLIIHADDPTLPSQLTGPVFALHLLGVSLGLGLMAVSAGAGAFFLIQERSIKSKTPLNGFRKGLPALMSLDRTNSLATLIGFPAYSLGLLCGFIWAGISWGTAFSGDAKELVSVVVGVMYAFLFHKRQVHGWRGRKPALMVIVMFTVSLFSLLVVNTWLSTHHSFDARF